MFLLAKIANYEFACQCKCLGLCQVRITLFHACYGCPCVKKIKNLYPCLEAPKFAKYIKQVMTLGGSQFKEKEIVLTLIFD